LARGHLLVGAFTLAVFLLSGVYLRTHNPPLPQLEPGLHALFVSRHIYILAAALLNLVVGAYLRPAAVGRRIQRIGSLLLMLGAVLLMAAFVVEPIARESRTPFSSFGIFAVFGGSLSHVVAGVRRRD